MKWGYIRFIWEFGDTLEVEDKHTGRYGAEGRREKKGRKLPRKI